MTYKRSPRASFKWSGTLRKRGKVTKQRTDFREPVRGKQRASRRI